MSGPAPSCARASSGGAPFHSSRIRLGRGSGRAMNRVLLIVYEINTWVGKTAGWCIVILTFPASYEVFMRYLFLAPTEWAFDASYMLYGTLFMLAGAYTLARNGHVRADFISRAWPPRQQATFDVVLYFLFFFPGMLAFVYAGF